MNEKQSDINNQKRIPIRTRVLRIALMTTVISLLAASATWLICLNMIRSASEEALTEQLEANLKNIVKQKAVAADAKLEHYEKYIIFSTDYIERMYKSRKKVINAGRMFYPPRNTKEYALTRAFASDKLTAEELKDEILFFSNLELIWEPIAKENEDLITTIYTGTKSGLLTSYDRWSYLSVTPKGEELIYDYTESSWYKQGLNENGVFYTGLYVDSQGRGLTITVASPFRDTDGRIAGVDAADFDITNLYNDMLNVDLGEGTFSFTLDRDGSPISPDADKMSAEEITGLTAEQVQKLMEDPDGLMAANDSIYVCVPLDRVGWRLCACVPMSIIRDGTRDLSRSAQYTLAFFIAIAIFLLILSVIAVNKAADTITYPLTLLGRDMKRIADGDLKHRATVYRNDEIGDMTNELNKLVDRLTTTMDDLISAKQRADAMSKLAVRDSLTGIRNKTAYEALAKDIDQKLETEPCPFGIVMIDMNNLKEINDSYGHNNGDVAIKKVSKAICDVFAHSPVFRIGGDEFVVVLMNADYGNVEALADKFKALVKESSEDTSINPWERISAAIGYSLYNEKTDQNVQSVLEKADKEMYKCKRTMETRDK